MKLFIMTMLVAVTLLTLFYHQTADILSLCDQIDFETDEMCDSYVRSKQTRECMLMTHVSLHYCRIEFIPCEYVDCQ
jgi:hypothetical protein